MSNIKKTAAESPDKRLWFVRMSSGSMFGPINTKGLVFWAEEGRIMPDDEISEDRTNWIAAQDLPELEMDRMIEKPDGSFAGPFNARAIAPLAREGKIPPDARTIHRDELEATLEARQQQPDLFEMPPPDDNADEPTPARAARRASGEVANLKRENKELSERLAQLEETLEEIQVQAKDFRAESEREVEELRIALEVATTERDEAKADAEQAVEIEAELAKLREDVATAVAERDAAIADAENLAAEFAGTDKVDAQLAEETVRRETAEKRVTEIEAGLAKLREDVATAVAERDAAIADAENLEAEFAGADKVDTQLAEETVRRETAEKRVAEIEAELAKLHEDVATAVAERDAAASDYAELLAFSNQRDAELEARLAELTNGQDTHSDSPDLSDSSDTQPEKPSDRVTRKLERQIVELRHSLETANEQLEKARAEAARAARPPEAEISRIEAFAEAALGTLRTVFEQEKTLNEQARAASAARQEALANDIDQLQRSMKLAPDGETRTQQLERSNDRMIARLKNELEAARRQHQTELHHASEQQRELEQRISSLEKRESATRDELARVEMRATDHDSMANQLRRRENALLAAEREFETARQQWQAVEMALMRRIEELESGASRLLAEQDDPPANRSTKLKHSPSKPWIRLER